MACDALAKASIKKHKNRFIHPQEQYWKKFPLASVQEKAPHGAGLFEERQVTACSA
jgi:hypothetical protein